MPFSRLAVPDPLHPDPLVVAAAWRERVLARRAQAARHSEVPEGLDFCAPVARRFEQDPGRRGDVALELLLERTRPTDVWLDIGAGGGRYALPLAGAVSRVVAVEPSAAMRTVLLEGMRSHGISNVVIDDGDWPAVAGRVGRVEVSLMAQVGYDTADMTGFLDAAEEVTTRACVAVLREGAATTPGQLLWEEMHGEPRLAPPVLPELLTLLLARGTVPEVRMATRATWGYADADQLLEVARRQLRIRAGSAKDRRLIAIVDARATERDGKWALDWTPMRDGIVTWAPPHS